jgi:LCT (Lysosomal Cystine Transporter) family transporter
MTHDVGHITLFLNCTIDTEDLFAEVSIGKSAAITLISVIVGWIYFAAWSASFYPQIVTNYNRKSVIGLNFDFLALNLMGFTFYSIFNICLYFIPSFQDAYKDKNPFSSIPVELNDVVFALHAVTVTTVTVMQCFLYERGNQRLARWSILFICSAAFVAVILLILVLTNTFSKLSYIYYFSYVKLTITIIKYVPQAWYNYVRKSTVGWSIGNILLDLTGGLLSILQMILLSANFNDWGSIFGNPTKFGLGFFSILFDALFITQHYFLYRHVDPDEGSQILTP